MFYVLSIGVRGTLSTYGACSPVVMIAIMAVLRAKRPHPLRSFV